MTDLNEKHLAVLIDADNISAKNIKNMLIEISRYGIPTIKRIYGDWTKPDLGGWKNSLLEHAITPMQQYGYTSGKNSTDSAMIIDAMDILYTDAVDGFCIVSSDSDFTRLAIRLREAGKMVYGIGEKKTPVSFIAACSKFIYVEILGQTENAALSTINGFSGCENEPETDIKTNKVNSSEIKSDASLAIPKIDDNNTKESLKGLFSSSVTALSDEDGWAYLAAVGAHVSKKRPEFDPRNYGYPRLTPLLRSLNAFEFEERAIGNTKAKQIYIRNKPVTIVISKKKKKSKKPNDEIK